MRPTEKKEENGGAAASPSSAVLCRLNLLWAAAALLLSIAAGAQDTSKKKRQPVKLKFYQITVDMWTKNKYDDLLKKVVAEVAKEYCSNSNARRKVPKGCPTNSNFSSKDVIILDEFPVRNNGYLEIHYYITKPATADNTTTSPGVLLEHAVIKAISANVREKLAKEYSIYITYIDKDFYGIPVNLEENLIIIAISIGILFIFIFVVVVLEIRLQQKLKFGEKPEPKKKVAKNISQVAPASVSMHFGSDKYVKKSSKLFLVQQHIPFDSSEKEDEELKNGQQEKGIKENSEFVGHHPDDKMNKKSA